MSVKGKIYGKYLKRAKYVVKGKKLKSPIATIQKRELGGKPKTESEYAGKTVYNNVTPSVNKTSVGTVQSKVQMAKKNGNDISFSELGKKIVEGEDNTKGSKRDSKTLMFVIVSLAIIIVAGMVKVGSMVYKEMTPKSNVASSNEKVDKKDSLSDFLLDGSDDSDEEVVDEVEATVEPTIAPEATDEEKKTEEESKDKDKTDVEILLTENGNNQDNTSDKKGEIVNPNNPLDYLNQLFSTATPTNKPTTPTTPTSKPTTPTTKPPVTAGDDSSSKYIEIGRVSNACDIYHVSKASVSSSAVKSNKYSKAKIEGGKIKVLTSDLNGIWFYDDGSGIKVIKGYENGVSVYVNTATLYEKEDDDYVYKSKIYVLTDHYIDLDDEYSKEMNASEGQRRFYMDYNYDLYKV